MGQRVGGLVLAAGKGTRMKSPLPKVLHPIGGRPMLGWVLQNLTAAGVADVCVVIGGEVEKFLEPLAEYKDLTLCIQNQRRGTGDAVASAAAGIEGAVPPDYADGTLYRGVPITADYLLICAGDVPGIDPSLLKSFCDACLAHEAKLGVIGMHHPKPFGYGRLVKDDNGGLLAIVEEKDADEATRKIGLCNTGIVFAKTDWLFSLLSGIGTNNSQNEYYLTDCFALAKARGEPAFIFETDDWLGFNGVNDPQQLAEVGTRMAARGFF